jgi:hypothetical protein
MMLDPRTRSARPGTRRLALLMVLGLVLAACDLEDLGDPDAVEDDEDVTVDDAFLARFVDSVLLPALHHGG